ncbi:MAG: AlpA family transcriptional regulator [Halothiobacillus sp. 20-54-6]|jgi:prophage regulatory protein|nr:MAG: AlpA family transcriptional regulator [Halothiobacillus sp. 20-54-6]
MKDRSAQGADLDIILRMREVLQASGASRSSIYVWMSLGLFPQPVKIGVRAIGWRKSDVLRWLDERQSTICA